MLVKSTVEEKDFEAAIDFFFDVFLEGKALTWNGEFRRQSYKSWKKYKLVLNSLTYCRLDQNNTI